MPRAICAEHEPDVADAHRYLGLSLARMGRHDEAVVAFRKVTDLTPRTSDGYNLLARELAAVGRPQPMGELAEHSRRTHSGVMSMVLVFFLHQGMTRLAYGSDETGTRQCVQPAGMIL